MTDMLQAAASLSINGQSSSSSQPTAKAKSSKPAKAPLAGANIQHPKFAPTYLARGAPSPLPAAEGWITPLSAPAYFSLDVFQTVLRDLALHPEQNSSLILRAESMRVTPSPEDAADDALAATLGCEVVEKLRLRLLPRQARRDAQLETRDVEYADPAGRYGLVLKTPEVQTAAEMPYYHPPVRKLAFVWESNGVDGGIEAEDTGVPGARLHGTLYVGYLPFPDTAQLSGSALSPPPKPARRRSPLAGPSIGEPATVVAPPATVLEEDTEEARAEAKLAAERRLHRTCLALLERLHKHGHGTTKGYQKRVHHDVIISREPFQDLYQALKERHKHLDSRVPHSWSSKVEDVKRHVWKDSGSPDDRLLPHDLSLWGSQDIAIAAFLMLLWRDLYPAREGDETGMEWDTWGRPPGGFVDLGCGNGLVVHILVSEGYVGRGYELRARRTWPQYPKATQDSLVELAIDFPSWFPNTIEEWEAGEWDGKEECVVKDGSFILGNHADEITPWIPLLSLIPSKPVPFLSLPCCLHTWDEKFMTLEYVPPPHPQEPEGGIGDGLEAGQSRYKAYVMWLGWVGLMCGWKWEKESLRIPSTRGWGVVARRRWTTGDEDRACRQWALEQVQGVRERKLFQVRVKEGKDH